ncbi:CAP domain-containing protein [Lutibacter sp. TH_r2]|uniref:CAP domain-containing protein n=1 Tax=Lutibacter sp. TH_r2 TaxID=3082083 RepID=UPI00295374E3|nr:CAP domain-containing protein [Lutibacter sp. TH_r2]MDV7186815.1 CAP domain-containing protein [Lutibacter sp. TH_r2]
MKPLKVILTTILLTLFISCSNDDDENYFNQITETKSTYTQIEIDILQLVNNHRQNIGLQKLKTLNIVSSVALSHSKHMVETGKVSHDNFSNRQEKLVVNVAAKSVAENVGFGYTSANDIVNAWIKSDSHRAALENPNFNYFGISTEKNKNGKNYFTQIFIKK